MITTDYELVDEFDDVIAVCQTRQQTVDEFLKSGLEFADVYVGQRFIIRLFQTPDISRI